MHAAHREKSNNKKNEEKDEEEMLQNIERIIFHMFHTIRSSTNGNWKISSSTTLKICARVCLSCNASNSPSYLHQHID